MYLTAACAAGTSELLSMPADLPSVRYPIFTGLPVAAFGVPRAYAAWPADQVQPVSARSVRGRCWGASRGRGPLKRRAASSHLGVVELDVDDVANDVRAGEQ